MALWESLGSAQTQFLADAPGDTIHYELHTFEQMQQTVPNGSKTRAVHRI